MRFLLDLDIGIDQKVIFFWVIIGVPVITISVLI